VISNNKISKQRILFFQMINKTNENQNKELSPGLPRIRQEQRRVAIRARRLDEMTISGLSRFNRKKKINKLTICIGYHRQIIRE
jgi:hypothetical protein